VIIVIGIAGAGKSTQGKLLAEHLGCPWLSVGKLLREKVGDRYGHQLLAGEIIDDTELLPLLGGELKKLRAESQELVLDGSPRTMHQAEWLAALVKQGQVKLTAIIHLLAPKKTVHVRLLKRGRPDDTEAAIAQRFKEYDDAILPILAYLSKQGFKIHEISGEGSVEEVNNRISQALIRNNHS